MTTWVQFTDEAAFHAFHDAACSAHGIPHPGRNVEAGTVELAEQWTTAYVEPLDDHGTVKAQVPEADVATYGLTPTTAPLWFDPDTGEPVADPPTEVDWNYHKDPGTRLGDFTDADTD
jgi:hypothetical protein